MNCRIASCLSHQHMFHGTRHYILKTSAVTFIIVLAMQQFEKRKRHSSFFSGDFFGNNESLCRSCTHEITVTTGCWFCYCWKKILFYLEYLPDFDPRCSGSNILFFFSFIESVPKVKHSKQSSNTKLSKKVAVTVTQANHEVMFQHAGPKRFTNILRCQTKPRQSYNSVNSSQDEFAALKRKLLCG